MGTTLLVSAAISGCGGDGGAPVASDSGSSATTSPSTPTPAGPACSEVWVDGQHLQRGYTGCSDDGVWVAAETRRCASGQVLVTYGDRYYGALGAKVNDVGAPLTESDQYHRAIRACG